MNTVQVTVSGTLRPDGTLELAELPALPPGPVEVLIRSVVPPSAGQENWWEYLQRARAELEAMGHRFSTGEEINAYLEEMRSGDERVEEVYRQLEEEKLQDKPGC